MVHAVLYRELLKASRVLARHAATVPKFHTVNARMLEHQRGWHARCFPRPFTQLERGLMAATAGLPPAEVCEPLIKAAFAVRGEGGREPEAETGWHALSIDAGFGMLRQLRKLARWYEYSAAWHRLLSAPPSRLRADEHAEVEEGLCLLAAMRDPAVSPGALRTEIGAALDELAHAARLVRRANEAEASESGMDGVEQWLRSINHVLFHQAGTRLDLTSVAEFYRSPEASCCYLDTALASPGRRMTPLLLAEVYRAVAQRCGVGEIRLVALPEIPQAAYAFAAGGAAPSPPTAAESPGSKEGQGGGRVIPANFPHHMLLVARADAGAEGGDGDADYVVAVGQAGQFTRNSSCSLAQHIRASHGAAPFGLWGERPARGRAGGSADEEALPMLATVDVWALHAQWLVRALAGASASPADIRLQHRFADLLTDLRSYRFGATPTACNRPLSLGCAYCSRWLRLQHLGAVQAPAPWAPAHRAAGRAMAAGMRATSRAEAAPGCRSTMASRTTGWTAPTRSQASAGD